MYGRRGFCWRAEEEEEEEEEEEDGEGAENERVDAARRDEHRRFVVVARGEAHCGCGSWLWGK